MSEFTAQTARQIEARLGKVFPLVTVPVAVGGREWRVTCVQNQDALLNAVDTLERFPYGLLLWASAVALARWLAVHSAAVEGKRVLELGAGVGLPGLVARVLGASVWQTDHQPDALALAQLNAWQNGLSDVNYFVADWRDWTHTERYDALLGADILYDRPMHSDLERIFRQNLAPGGALLLTDPRRPQALEFASRLETAGWQMQLETQTVTLAWEDRPVEVGLLVGRYGL